MGKKISLTVGIAVASAAALVSTASATPLIYLTAASGGAPGGLTQLTNNTVDTSNGADVGNFSATSAPNVLFVSGGSYNYTPSYVTGINNNPSLGHPPGDSSDYLQVSGFNPTSDKEIYALKLDQNGLYLAPGSATVEDIIIDINDANSSTFGGSIASDVPSGLSQFFPGYDLIISIPYSYLTTTPGVESVSSSSNPEFDFGFNLSDFSGSTDSVSGTITVTDIGVIPEPASVAIIGFLAIPALLSRRRAAV